MPDYTNPTTVARLGKLEWKQKTVLTNGEYIYLTVNTLKIYK